MAAASAGQRELNGGARPRAMELYFLALAGRHVTVTCGAEPLPDSDRTVRLPASPPAAGRVCARAWYLVALAHRALHDELGTSGFSLRRAAPRLRRGLAGRPGEHDLETFLGSFADRGLAVLIFRTLEDLRVDAELLRRFPGLRTAATAMLAAAAARRPGWRGLAPRTAAAELLARCSLSQPPRSVPAPLETAAAALLPLAASLARPGASVEDVALASTRAYAAAVRLPNLGTLGEAPLVAVEPLPPEDAPWPDPWPEPARERIEGDAVLGVQLQRVPHREELTGRGWRAPAPPAPSEQAVYTWRANEQEGAGSGPAVPVAGPPQPLPHEHHDLAPDLRRPERGPLGQAGPRSYLYPEWDARRCALLPRWCRVTEEPAAYGDPRAVADLQRRHHFLLVRLRRLVQSAAPRAFEVQRRAADGDDVDFDAAVAALAGLRAGRIPDDGVYQQLRPRRRDTVVGLLVDASSSTGERMAGAPLGPRKAPLGYRDRPRILDTEIAATVLCLTAIDAAGDASAAWAFSSTGREAVRLQVLKTLPEPFGGRVLRRAAAVKPGHGTRMGAAIRHAATVLAAAPQANRLLLVVSDGRPCDIGYGQQYGEAEAAAYAWADTTHALAEARRAGVRPVILTISSAGGGLPPGARPGDVEVLPSISLLPERLTGLYRDITANPRPAAGRAAGHH